MARQSINKFTLSILAFILHFLLFASAYIHVDFLTGLLFLLSISSTTIVVILICRDLTNYLDLLTESPVLNLIVKTFLSIPIFIILVFYVLGLIRLLFKLV